MANVNYISPGDPYGDFKPNGFLAGWMYPQKLREHYRTYDLSTQGMDLANQQASENLNTYRLDAPVRAGARNATLKDQDFTEQKRPLDQSYTLADLEGRNKRQQYELESKLLDSMRGLDDAKYNNNINTILQTQRLISQMPLESEDDYDTAVGLMNQAGMDTKYWDDYYVDTGESGELTGSPVTIGDTVTGPTVNNISSSKPTKAQLIKKLQFIQRLNPELFKHRNAREIQDVAETGDTTRTGMNNATSIRVAEINAAANREGSSSARADDERKRLALSGLTKLEAGIMPTPEERAAIRLHNQSVVGRPLAAAEAGAQKPKAVIETLRPDGNQRPEFSTSQNLPYTPEQLAPKIPPPGSSISIGGQRVVIEKVENGVPYAKDPATGKLRPIRIPNQ